MGDLRDWSPELNGAVTEDRPVPSSPLSSSNCNPNHTEIGADCWGRAEQATQEIISHVQPTVVSEKRRKEVIDYVQSLIRNRLGCEVFPFGSVPLKTYLPDGDIDLTAFGGLNVEDALVDDLRSVLEGEEQNWAAKFVVKDVQPIRAEVKLVKCLVQNIVVDISFNQLGGLCTLCFLEQVDRLIGKSNLFKRSIILIKAWCYYESRILGAHHGLISTYALETLVLYIFHVFHSSLCGPLAVLYKFLDYFSKFDWDNYCISLNGPVRISALPELLAEAPENGGNDLLLSNEFIKDSVDMFSVPSRGSETISRTFPAKHLNIIDPLKESNNLGRSVSKGNFYRIRSAFTYGARKLGHILSRPEDSLADEIRKFFANTLDRHGKDQRPDVQEPMPLSPHNGCGPASPFSGIETSQADGSFSELESAELRGRSRQYRLDLEESSCNGIDNGKISGNGMECSQTLNESQRVFTRAIPSAVLLEAKSDANGTAFSGLHSGDVKDLATSRLRGLKISENTSKASSPRSEESMSPLGKGCHAPHFYFSRSYSGSAKMRDESPGWQQPENSDSADDQESMRVLPARDEERGIMLHHNQDEASGSRDDHLNSGSVGCSLDDFHPDYRERSSNGSAGSPEALNFLSNLSGDYENHISSLHYGRLCYDYAQSVPMPPPLLSQSQSKDPWGTVRWSGQLRQDVFPHMNANGFVPQAAFYAVNAPVIPGAAFVMEEKPKPRGTGTYFPNTNHYRDRPSSSRGRNQAQVRSPRNNGRAVMPPETNLLERSSRELSQAQFPVHQSGGKPRFSDFPQTDFPGGTVFPSANGPILPAERVAELGSFVHPPSEGPSQDSNGQQNTELSSAQSPHTSLPRPAIQRQKSVLGVNQDRIVAVQSYRLKDEDDFPPLSV